MGGTNHLIRFDEDDYNAGENVTVFGDQTSHQGVVHKISDEKSRDKNVKQMGGDTMKLEISSSKEMVGMDLLTQKSSEKQKDQGTCTNVVTIVSPHAMNSPLGAGSNKTEEAYRMSIPIQKGHNETTPAASHASGDV